MLTHISGDKPVTILTATSGDTVRCCMRSTAPKNVRRGDPLSERQNQPASGKTVLHPPSNIETVAIDGDFDACQALVKQAFDDEELKAALGLNSANSSTSAVCWRICYYFRSGWRSCRRTQSIWWFPVPAGTSSVTAGLLAKITRPAGEALYRRLNDTDRPRF